MSQKCQKCLKNLTIPRWVDIYMIRVEKTDCDTRYESQSLLQNYQQSAQIMKHCAQALSLPTHRTWSTLNAAVLMGNSYTL